MKEGKEVVQSCCHTAMGKEKNQGEKTGTKAIRTQ